MNNYTNYLLSLNQDRFKDLIDRNERVVQTRFNGNQSAFIRDAMQCYHHFGPNWREYNNEPEWFNGDELAKKIAEELKSLRLIVESEQVTDKEVREEIKMKLGKLFE